MERKRIEQTNCVLKSGDYLIDSFNDAVIEIEVNSVCDILLTNLSDNASIKLVVDKDCQVTLSALVENIVNNAKISINVKGNSYLSIYFADFARDTFNLKCDINLDEEGATAYCKLASLASKKDNKNIDINVNHNTINTYGKVDNYGVCKDEAKLTFLGTSHIMKGSVKSKTQQNAKIMVFDQACNAIAKPILKIDENDIEASHGAVVGKISDEHLFYLTSRGISENQAKELITFGYLKPILLGFKEEQIKDHISSLIEGRM